MLPALRDVPATDSVAAQDLGMAFGARVLFEGATFALRTGRVIGLVGTNGVGKSTLLRVLAGLLPATRGHVSVLGLDPRQDGTALRAKLGVLVERPGHYDELTVRENLAFFYSLYAGASDAIAQAVERMIGRLDLMDVADEPAGTLSAGYRQRLALARAWHPQAECLLLDEPFDGLDPAVRVSLKEALRDFRASGATVLFSSHDVWQILDLCDEVLVLAAGTLGHVTSVDELRTGARANRDDPDLGAVYVDLLHSAGARPHA